MLSLNGSVISFATRLRRLMPRVAACSAALFIVWLIINPRRFYQQHALSSLFGLITFFTISVTIVYYGLIGLRWSRRRLLWRVRRRLVVTYLFVGLTPVVLLTALGLLAGFAVSSAAMSRLITDQINATEAQTLASARIIAKGLSNMQASNDKSIQSWLRDKDDLLQAVLPGARVAVWRARNQAESDSVAERESATFVSEPSDPESAGVGNDKTPVGAPIPGWLNGSSEWSGLVVIPPAEPGDIFASPSLRAVAHANGDQASYIVLLSVPISRSLIKRLQESSGFKVEPFFFGDPCANVRGDGNGLTAEPCKPQTKTIEIDFPHNERSNNDRQIKSLERDQLGEPRTGNTPVILPATNWLSGEKTDRLAFVFEWSIRQASSQLLGSSVFGRVFRTIVIIAAVIFMVLELLALLAGTWMTHAITGTVHRLYQATELIKLGDFSHRVKVRSHDQLGELAEAFNEMLANIESLLHERVERERLQREVEIAAEVQAQLFPRAVPKLLTAEISGECRAARGVAGDYYDYIELVHGLVAVSLGDVSGKGLSASLVMSNLQATLRAQVAIAGERLRIADRATAAAAGVTIDGQILAQMGAGARLDGAISGIAASINEQLCRSTDADRFATLFLALYDDETQILRYTNAGHNAAVLVRGDRSVERLSDGGLIVGAFDWATYEESATKLIKDDLLVIFSDGITEAENPHGEEYGEKRLQSFIVENISLSAQSIREAVFEEIARWSGDRERGDDQTLMVIKRV